MTAIQYAAIFADNKGRSAKMHFNSDSDDHAAIVADTLAIKSNASWVGLQKAETLTVDSGTYTNFNASGKPVSGCTVRDQGWLFYGVQSRRQQLRVTIPAVVSSLLSSTTKTVGTDPIAGVGKLIDEEGVTTTSFVRGKYEWRKRKR